MVHTRGSSDDYDEFARLTGDPGWSWESMLPYFMKVRTSCSHTTNLVLTSIWDRMSGGRLLTRNVRTRCSLGFLAVTDHPIAAELDCTRTHNPSVHGTKGKTSVSQSAYGSEVDCVLLSTTEDPESEFSFNKDFNSGTPLGLGEYQ